MRLIEVIKDRAVIERGPPRIDTHTRSDYPGTLVDRTRCEACSAERTRRHRLYTAAVVTFAAIPLVSQVLQRADGTMTGFLRTSAIGAGALVVVVVTFALATVTRFRRAAAQTPLPYRGVARAHCPRHGG